MFSLCFLGKHVSRPLCVRSEISRRPEQLVKLQQLWQRWCRRRKSSSLRIWQKRCHQIWKISRISYFISEILNYPDAWNHIWCCFLSIKHDTRGEKGMQKSFVQLDIKARSHLGNDFGRCKELRRMHRSFWLRLKQTGKNERSGSKCGTQSVRLKSAGQSKISRFQGFCYQCMPAWMF